MLPKIHESATLWVKNDKHLTSIERNRARYIIKMFRKYRAAPSKGEDNIIELSKPIPHGLSDNTLVTLVKVSSGTKTVVHMSDTQLLSSGAIRITLSWKPDIVITDGPPLYRWLKSRSQHIYLKLLGKAKENVLRIAQEVDVLIIDHHLMRCEEGIKWLREVKAKIGTGRIICVAEFMKKPTLLLEAWRPILYKYLGIKNDWFLSKYRVVVNENSIYRIVASKLLKELAKYTATYNTSFIPSSIVEDVLKVEADNLRDTHEI